MLTVEDVNKAFAEKGIHIKIPLPPHYKVKHMEVLERKTFPAAVGVLLNLKYVDDQGREFSDLFYCQGEVERKREAKPPPQPARPVKEGMLPKRETPEFSGEEEALRYLRQAIGHLLEDKGYKEVGGKESELYYEQEGAGFFVNLAPRCDEQALAKARALVELRRKYGPNHDYGLVVPAFQESLGVPLRVQESWITQNLEYLSAHRIGVYGVDNLDPNRIYPFTVYPRPRELMRYFLWTSQQWSFVRSRYVESRGR